MCLTQNTQMAQQKIKTALLAYGFSGETFFAPFLDLSEDFQLKGAWERSKKKIQKDYSYVKSYDALAEILEDTEVDLVVVNTPIDTHYQFAKQVLEAGKHAIVEKAFTNSAAEARELHELAKAKGLHLFVFQNRRFDADFKTARTIYQSGKLGQVVEATISYDFYIPQTRGDVHTEKPKSGGEYNNRGSHITDQAVALFGIPKAVLADFAAFRPNSQVEDYFLATLIYDDKRVKLRATDISFENQPGYIFHGMQGSYIQDRTDRQEEILLEGTKPTREDWTNFKEYNKGKLAYLDAKNEKQIEYITSEEGNYFEYFDGVYNTIRNRAQPHISGWDGYRTMVVMEAVYKSAATGTKVTIDYEGIEK